MKKIIYVGSGMAVAGIAIALAAASVTLAQRTPPNSSSDRPGSDMQSNVGSVVVDPVFNQAPGANRNPPELPPSARNPTITEEERQIVTPPAEDQQAPNVSRTTEDETGGKMNTAEPGSTEWREQRE